MRNDIRPGYLCVIREPFIILHTAHSFMSDLKISYLISASSLAVAVPL